MNKISLVASGLLTVWLMGQMHVHAAEILSAEQRWSATGPGGSPGFTRHVQPLLGKLGCSNRACHGSFQGQGGFRLSLFSSDPQLDHDNLVKGERVNPSTPAESLALRKATRAVAHKGGKRFDKDSWQYLLLRDWIGAGAPYLPGKEAVVARLEVAPAQLVLAGKDAKAPLKVRAHFSDGTVEDVTGLTQFTSNDDAIAAAGDSGDVTARHSGDTVIVATFGGAVISIPILVPFPGERSIRLPVHNKVDEFAAAKLAKLGIAPSELSSDEEFLRRASIDITGSLPTPKEIMAFCADAATDKRSRKIDELLDRPAYAVWWTTKFCDLTGLNAPLFLGNTNFGPMIGEQWQRWIERRLRDNVAYDKIVAGIVLGTSRKKGQSYEDFVLEQSRYVRTKDPIDFAAQDQMPHFWFRGNIGQPEEKALAFAYSFLAVRLDCAQCHKHPFDRWTQQDFQQFTALFERVRTGVGPDAEKAHQKMKDDLGVSNMTAGQFRTLYWKLAREGKPAPWPEVYIGTPKPKKGEKTAEVHTRGKLLGGAIVDLDQVEDPRMPLMDWLRRRDNPYFAPAIVNRVWAHYFGKGLVDPPDDHNLANPASNPELLNYLVQGFIDHAYDLKWLHREVTNSRVYQLSWKPNDSNRDDDRNLSHARLRRLPAEVVVDAVRQATAGSRTLAQSATSVADRRIGVPVSAFEARTEYPLAIFGKPLRLQNCDCERIADPSLLQSIFLRNDQELLALLDRKDGWLNEVKTSAAPESLVREAYLRTLNRPPDLAELARCQQHLNGNKDIRDGLRDLLWALLNTQEFITNH